MKRIYLLVAFLVGMFLVPATATAITLEELNKLDSTTAAQVLSELNREEAATTVEKADEWISVAERLGKALESLAREAGMALNEFAKTPVGIITIAVLLWKTIGVSIVAGLVWALSLSIIIWSFRTFHVPVKNKVVVRDKEGAPIVENGKPKTEVTYVLYEFNPLKDSRAASAVAHAAMFVVINMMLIIAIAVS